MKSDSMKVYRFFCLLALSVAAVPVFGQEAGKSVESVEVDFDHPKTYYVGGITVEGNHQFSSQQIISLTGLQKGMRVTVPSDDISSIVSRLWMQRYFEDVGLEIDHLSENKDSAYFKIRIQERPRVSSWLFSGVRKGEQKDLNERLNLRREGSSPNMSQRPPRTSSSATTPTRAFSTARLMSRQGRTRSSGTPSR